MVVGPLFYLASAVEPHELLVTPIPALLSLWHFLYGTDHRSALRIITSGRRKEIAGLSSAPQRLPGTHGH